MCRPRPPSVRAKVERRRQPLRPLISADLWRWIEENRASFEPPVGNKVIWEDSQFTAMVIRGPNRRRDFHDDPSDEIFYMLRGAMTLEYIDEGGRRQDAAIREGELLLVPAHTLHSPHRPADTWGLVIEIKRGAADQESLIWLCERCDAELHRLTMSAMQPLAGSARYGHACLQRDSGRHRTGSGAQAARSFGFGQDRWHRHQAPVVA